MILIEGKYESLGGGWSTKKSMVLVGLACGSISGMDWTSFCALLSSKLVMVLELNCCLTFGVVKLLLRPLYPSCTCIVLPGTRMLL
jgi:hypothetical protein